MEEDKGREEKEECEELTETIGFVVEEKCNSNNGRGRTFCSNRCRRPINVCICSELPCEPISTSTQIVILQHPHELRHKLSTGPVLPLCLRRCQTLVGRRLRPRSCPLLDSQPRAIFLFPTIDPKFPSMLLEDFISSFRNEPSGDDLILILFDGTWRHAKEMVTASRDFLGNFAVQVSLGFDSGVEGGSIFDNELILRKEPFGGCMSTIEAVARALKLIEPNGAEIEERLLGVLRAMVRFQAGYLKPMKPRPRLCKKGKEKSKLNSNTEPLD
ncbi:tRNA-uridine aminocarboxypropyltransferase A [Aristolochia californica]|uniref:tRNA-uridine aminocarboxypropyltransferase A n=1 Tax=Aristolochia californica TaxID=171875 RepID=UPI0035D6CC66